MSSLEEEKNNMLNTSREELEKQENELKEKNFIINSLKEKLHSVEGYIQSLESNSTEVRCSCPSMLNKVHIQLVFYCLNSLNTIYKSWSKRTRH